MVLRGCYTAIVTPFSEKGTVDEKTLRSHIDFLIGKGVAGIVPWARPANPPRFRGKSTTTSLMSRWNRQKAKSR